MFENIWNRNYGLYQALRHNSSLSTQLLKFLGWLLIAWEEDCSGGGCKIDLIFYGCL